MGGKKNDLIEDRKIRDYFRKGVPSQDHDEMILNMKNAYKILAQIGGKELVGKSKKLLPGTFWKLDK